MKPFDLQKALAGDPVVTRDGRPVTGLHLFDGLTVGQRLYGVVGGGLESWCDNGVYTYLDIATEDDLFMATKKRTVYVNFLGCGDAAYHSTKELAIAGATNCHGQISGGCIAVAVPVEIEE